MSDTTEKTQTTEETLALVVAQTAFVKAVLAAEKEKVSQDVWGAKLFRSVNNAAVYTAGILVASCIGFGAIVGIAWLATQFKIIIWGAP